MSVVGDANISIAFAAPVLSRYGDPRFRAALFEESNSSNRQIMIN
jgi:hypothetical protein